MSPASTVDINMVDNLRPMRCELHALTRADGSALLTQGLINMNVTAARIYI